MRRLMAIILCLGITLLYPAAGTYLAGIGAEEYSIGWNYIHHILQMTLAFLTIFVYILLSDKKSWPDFGLSLNKLRWSLGIVIKFAAGWIVIAIILNLVFDFENHITYKESAVNIVSDLFFDFIITGLSEEILFRGLIFSVLFFYFPGKIKAGRFSISSAVILSTLFFCLAHVGIDFSTFKITYINSIQLIFTFGLGLFYAILREKSGSLAGPVLAHGISDGSITVIQLILA